MAEWSRNGRSNNCERDRAISSTNTIDCAASQDERQGEVVSLQEWHVERILSHLQADQVWGVSYVDIETYASVLTECGFAYSLVTDEEVWACAGVSELESHRATAWALVHEDIGLRFFKFHKGVKAFLDECKYQRVELITLDGFTKAERWAEMLGFKWEGCMEKYFPNGSMGNLYARIK